jgi:hypothetical protein
MLVWLITPYMHPVEVARSTIYPSWISNYATAYGLEMAADFDSAALQGASTTPQVTSA